jgi:hypothetical protein
VDSYARGERAFQNPSEIRTVEKVDFEQLLRFFSYIPRPESGFLRNMTSRTIGLANFDDFGSVVDRSDNDEYLEEMRRIREEKVQKDQEICQRRSTYEASVKSFVTESTRIPRLSKKIAKHPEAKLRRTRKAKEKVAIRRN